MPRLLPLVAICLLLGPAIARADQPSPPSAALKGDPVPGVFQELTALAFDRDDALWIGSRYWGILAFRKGKFELFDAYNTPIPDNGITAIYVDKNNTKWFGSDGGHLYSFDNARWQVFSAGTDPRFSAGRVVSIHGDAKGAILFATSESGFFQLADGKVQRIGAFPKAGPADRAVRGGVGARHGPGAVRPVWSGGAAGRDFDRQGRPWLAGRYALARFDGEAWIPLGGETKPRFSLSGLWCNPNNDNVYVAAADLPRLDNGRLQFTTTTDLYRFSNGEYHKVEGASGPERINVVRFAPDGRVAVGFFNPGGAVVGDGSHFRHYAATTPLENESVADIAFDKQGRIWFAGRRSGLQCLDGQKWKSYAPASRGPGPRLSWQRARPQDLVNQEPSDTDIHEVLKDPHKFLNKKIRIVGRIASSFEYAEMVDSHGEKLGIWPGGFNSKLGEFIESAGLKKELGSNDQPREFLGYLESGGHFGHMGGWSKEFTIVEILSGRCRPRQEGTDQEAILGVPGEGHSPRPYSRSDGHRRHRSRPPGVAGLVDGNRRRERGRKFSRPGGLALGDLGRPHHDRIARRMVAGETPHRSCAAGRRPSIVTSTTHGIICPGSRAFSP